MNNFGNWLFGGGLSKTIKRLENTPEWKEAERKTAKVVNLTLAIFLPYAIVSICVFYTSPYITLFMWLLLPLWIYLYWIKLLKPMNDRWNKR